MRINIIFLVLLLIFSFNLPYTFSWAHGIFDPLGQGRWITFFLSVLATAFVNGAAISLGFSIYEAVCAAVRRRAS